VTVRIGKPFELNARDATGKRRDLADLTDEMMIEIAKLLPDEYRGIYAERLRALGAKPHSEAIPPSHD
jgi:1-acyl-sn-glycerol-3-phosphate acyltransferase